jgi:septum formation protein
MTLILASKSASRRAMLDAAGVPYQAIPADVDEAAIKNRMLEEGDGPAAIALCLAEAKALAVSLAHPDALVLGSDSIASAGGRMFDKPVSREDAADHLRFFSTRVMTLDSAAAIARGGVLIDAMGDAAELQVRALGEDFIQVYLAAEWPAISGCVGCFRIEGRGVQLFEEIRGSQFTVLGMPLLPVLAMLREEGCLAS